MSQNEIDTQQIASELTKKELSYPLVVVVAKEETELMWITACDNLCEENEKSRIGLKFAGRMRGSDFLKGKKLNLMNLNSTKFEGINKNKLEDNKPNNSSEQCT